ncbi:replication-associated recombination protein A [Candidatus Dependentiae bacterium]|nr:replication-associated recombination protein A [Candidatus Dependentiae bacterium]
MNDLFTLKTKKNIFASLSERMRPETINEIVGQDDILGKDKPLRLAIESDDIPSIIFWGPPGSGKTSIANVISNKTNAFFVIFSATNTSTKEVKKMIEEAKHRESMLHKRTIIFIDEVHRYNKGQQDVFLPHIEAGTIIFIGATTENPSFQVNAALLSRTKVFILKSLSENDIITLLKRAIKDKTKGLGNEKIKINNSLLKKFVQACSGDARTALDTLEFAVNLEKQKKKGEIILTELILNDALQKKILKYDKGGEEHYNIISALHKSLRGSNVDASLYWLGRMLEAGESPLYVARRLIRFASEDIGNADPHALVLAVAAMQTIHFIGMPECNNALAQLVIYLATAPKSNSVYVSYQNVQKIIRETGELPVPLHIRNAPTELMKDIGYGKNYKYPHDYEDTFVQQDYLPEKLKNRKFYFPIERGFEREILKRLEYWQRLKIKKKKDGAK